VIALARGWRPNWRVAGTLLALPLVSVAAFAFAFGNPFNGAVFAVAASGLIALAMTSSSVSIHAGPRWATAAGIALVAFGWLYPHFLTGPAFAYVYAAPTGLVPCPTLATAIGFALVAGASVPRAWALLLGAVGMFYGVIGVGRLGVILDLPLIAGAVLLAGHSVAFGNAAHVSGRLRDRRKVGSSSW
jgi:hypothetical protein